jgi:hypothetical protein
MAKKQNGAASNGKIAAKRIRAVSNNGNGDGVRSANGSFVRSSHSLSTNLANRLRKLAYEKQTSESSIIECALWLFFYNGSDANVLRLMDRAEIEPRRRRI